MDDASTNASYGKRSSRKCSSVLDRCATMGAQGIHVGAQQIFFQPVEAPQQGHTSAPWVVVRWTIMKEHVVGLLGLNETLQFDAIVEMAIKSSPIEHSILSLGEFATNHIWDDLNEVMGDNELTDFTLRGKDSKEFHCHKIILAARSPVFKDMFLSSKDPQEKNLVLQEMTCDGLQAMIDHMYGRKGELRSIEAAKELMTAADKYNLSGGDKLIKQCEMFLMTRLNWSTVREFIDWSGLQLSKALTNRVADIVNKKFQVMGSASKLQLVQNTEAFKLLDHSNDDEQKISSMS